MNSSAQEHHDRDRDRSTRSHGERRSASPSRAGRTERGTGDAAARTRGSSGRSSNRRHRDASPSRRSVSSDGGNNTGNERHRRQHREKRGSRGTEQRRRRRRISNNDDNQEEVVFDWGRSSPPPRSPRRMGTDTAEITSRQIKQISSPPLTDPQDETQYEESMNFDPFDQMAANHPDANPALRRAGTAPAKNASKAKRSSKLTPNKNDGPIDIDAVITQFKEHTTAHMATLLDFKTHLANLQQQQQQQQSTVNTESEKDKEFQQVRQWYGALAEKHTKLEKEHKALQEEHQKLKEKYATLQRASTLNDSFAAHFGVLDAEKESRKKDKKDKNKLEVVWSRAGKITKSATKKVHQKLTNEGTVP